MSEAPAAAGHKILVAGAAENPFAGFCRALAGAGYIPLQALTGPEAISLCCLEQPPVVLIDADLPGGGPVACRDLLETEAGLDAHVILVLPDDVEDSREAAFQAGAHDVLPRRCGPAELLSKIALALRGWSVSTELRARNRELTERVDRGLGELDHVNRRLKQQLQRQQTLLELTQEMNASLQAEEQANVLLLSIVGQLGVQTAALYASDPDAGAMTFMAAKGADAEACAAISEADRAAWRLFLEIDGASPLEGIVPAELARLGFALMVPIRYRERIGGALLLGPKLTGQPYSPGDIRMLETMGNSFAIALQNAALYRKLQLSYVTTIEALVSAIEAKDPYTRGHTARVARYARAIARELDLDRELMQQVDYGAALHDVGKIGIFEQVLNKRGDLTSDEREMIRRHPIVGDRILARIDFLAEARLAVRHHHERIDGTGYPDGLRGEQIPLVAKIVAVADAFDAMTTTRSYSEPISLAEAISHLETKSGTQFDAEIVAAFVRLLGSGRIRPEETAAVGSA